MKESSLRTVHLPEDDPRAFELVLKSIYDDNISSPINDERTLVDLLIKTYFLANKLCMEALANDIMDIVKGWHSTHFVYASLVQDLPQSPMRMFLVHTLAWDIIDPLGNLWEQKDCLQTDEVADLFRVGGELVVEIMRLCGKITKSLRSGEETTRPWEWPDCDFHQHVDTYSCVISGSKDSSSTYRQSEFLYS